MPGSQFLEDLLDRLAEALHVDGRRPEAKPMGLPYYDKAGRPISSDVYMRLFEQEEYRRVLWDGTDEVHVSTVWLGLDHGWGRSPPVIFETMVFGGPRDGTTRRYHTEAEARAGHQELVAEVLGSPATKRLVDL